MSQPEERSSDPPNEPSGGAPRKTPAVWLATGLGAGFSPVAPGTVGTLWGLPLAVGLSYLPLVAQLVAVVVLAAVGVPLCTRAARDLGGGKDPGAVVYDEFASLPITFLFVAPPLVRSPWVLAVGYLLFRLFDIAKPPPCRQLEGLGDGLGIMADDWAAALYACAALHLVLWLGWLPV